MEYEAVLPSVGVWHAGFGRGTLGDARAFAAAVEAAGYQSLWFGESSSSREPLTFAGELLHATSRLVVATGIASIWVRDAVLSRAAAATLAEASGDRFVLGLGVSHADMVGERHQHYATPLTHMARYLDRLDAPSAAPPAWMRPTPRVLAALGPAMLRLAAERTDGAHPYFVPVRHTEFARSVLGPGPQLLPEQGFVLSDDPVQARALARRHMAFYLDKPNYVRMLRRTGYGDTDLADGGSDRLVDDLVAWGGPAEIAGRVRQHLAAGATRVLLQPLHGDVTTDLDALVAVADGLGA